MKLRDLKIKNITKRFYKPIVIVVYFALIFGIIAIVQHWFIKIQLQRTVGKELASWVQQIVSEIDYKNRWNLEGYRRSAINAPSWFIIENNGLVVDIEGFIPNLFNKMELPNQNIYGAPKTISTVLGETWRIFGRKIDGGYIVVGVRSINNLNALDKKLLSNAKRFGSTIEQAISLRPRNIDLDVDYMVISSNEELKAAWGGLPLRIKLKDIPVSFEHMTELVSDNRKYLLYTQPIRDDQNHVRGIVIVPKDMTFEQEALDAQDRFNYFIFGIAMLLISSIVIKLISGRIFSQNRQIKLEEALRNGESDKIEFKGSYTWDIRQQQYNEDRKSDILKAITGFLNGRGGTLFIGVSEDKDTHSLTVCGIREDLNHFGESKDLIKRNLRDSITARIGSQFACYITDNFEEWNDQSYWRIEVDASDEPAFVRLNNKKFYVREGPKTSELDSKDTYYYIKNRWG